MSLKPLSGDPATVQTRADALIAAAAAMEEAKAQLEHIEKYAGYTSGAVKALGHKVGDLRSLVGKAHTRYHDAGEALSTYAKALKTAQTDAATAISNYDGLQGTLAAAQADADDKKIDPLNLDTTQADVDAAQAAHTHLTNVQGEVDAAVTAYNKAKAARDSAAETAKGAIERANDASDLDNSRWDNFTQWVSDHTSWVDWKLIKDIADIVALVATVAGVILSFTPLAPLGAALIVVGRIASAISFAVTLVQFARGDIGLKTLAIGLLFAATGGLGKLGKLKGLKGLKGAFKGGLTPVLARAARGLRSGMAGGMKNLGKKATDLNVADIRREYQKVKKLADKVEHDKKLVHNIEERSAKRGEDYAKKHEKLLERRQDNLDKSIHNRNAGGREGLKNLGLGAADGTAANLLNGDVKVAVSPGLDLDYNHGGVTGTGVDSNIPIFHHSPIQIVGSR